MSKHWRRVQDMTMCECPRCGQIHRHLQAGKPPYVFEPEDGICQCPACGRMHKQKIGRDSKPKTLALP